MYLKCQLSSLKALYFKKVYIIYLVYLCDVSINNVQSLIKYNKKYYKRGKFQYSY